MISAGSQELTQKWVDVLHNSDDDYIIPESDVNVMCPYDCLNMSGASYTANGTGMASECDVTQLKNAPNTINRNKKIATFEWNYWVLDGSFDVLDTDEKFNGYISILYSNANCTFTTSPFCFINRTDGNTFALNKNQTLKFNPQANECPAILNLRSRYTNEQEQTVTVNNIDFDIEEMLEDEDLHNQEYINLYSDDIDTTNSNTQVIMTFTKTLMPFRRVKISEYNNGYKFFKGKYDLLSFVHTRTTSLNSTELPQNNLQCAFVDLEGVFDKENHLAPFHINFNKTTYRFYVYYGYNFDDIGWSYVLADTLCYDNIEINREGVETTLNLKSTLLLKTQKYPQGRLKTTTQSQSYPYNWTTFAGFVTAIKQLSGMATITIPNDSTRPTGVDVSYNEWQERLYFNTKTDKTNGFHQIACNELLQQIVALLGCCIVRNPDETMFIKNTTISGGETEVDYINKAMILSYPTITEETPYKYIYFETPEINSQQESDKEAQQMAGDIVVGTLLPSRKRYTMFDDEAANEEIYTQRVLPLDYKNGNQCWTWITDNQFFQSCLQNYNRWYGAKNYEFGETILNPLLQVADKIYVDIGGGVYLYRGLISKIEINYDGSFKGAITICSPFD